MTVTQWCPDPARLLLAWSLVVLAVCLWPARSRHVHSTLAGYDRSTGGATPAAIFRSRLRRDIVRLRLGAATWGSAVPGLRRILLARSARRREAAFLTAMDALAPALEAGLPPAAAVREISAAGVDPQVGAMLVRLAGNDPVQPGGHDPEPRPSTPHSGHDTPATDGEAEALLARAWQLVDHLGTPLATTVRTVADLARDARDRREALAAGVAEARASVRVLIALPVAGPLVAPLLGLDPAGLYRTPVAAISAALGLLLVLAGRTWMTRLIARVAAVEEAP